jgi:hypothetical protein
MLSEFRPVKFRNQSPARQPCQCEKQAADERSARIRELYDSGIGRNYLNSFGYGDGQIGFTVKMPRNEAEAAEMLALGILEAQEPPKVMSFADGAECGSGG